MRLGFAALVVAVFFSTAESATHTAWSASGSIDSTTFYERVSEDTTELDSRTHTVERSATETTLDTHHDPGTVIILK
jgi:hypothetical protein